MKGIYDWRGNEWTHKNWRALKWWERVLVPLGATLVRSLWIDRGTYERVTIKRLFGRSYEVSRRQCTVLPMH